VSERSNATELCRDCLHAWAWHFHVNQTGTACLFWDCGCHGFAPAAPPPEGSREPQKWPCRVAKGTQCSSEMCEPPTPPPGQEGEAVARRVVLANGNYCDRHEPELQLVCERCGSREATPPPGPGQDRQVVITQGERSMEQEHILQFFSYEHLPPKLQAVSKPFCDLAHAVVKGDNVPETGTVTIGGPLPRNPERTVALRKLLEAKDAAVRALLAR
jgi:hypothetical protein